ncbi:MAG: exodeoxyribonuclease VII small subunit [Acidimicrobiaceae bacterium]|nr:exodeoxyribonuclease VII small subunit [Acidimicrobiaceae bacterium]
MTDPQQGDNDGRSFEELLDELEAITERLATGELGIEAATELFERAQELHGRASARLAEVQARVDRLARATHPAG